MSLNIEPAPVITHAPLKQESWPARHKVMTAFGAMLVIGIIASAAGGAGSKPKDTATSPASSSSTSTVSTPTTTDNTPAVTQPIEPAKPSMTAGQIQATRSAQQYLSFEAFSRKGLIQQLSSSAGSGFSVADATYAVDHLKVNWNDQAVKAAKQYLQMMSFSHNGLVEQLSSSAGSGFTHAQAEYGVNGAGL
jgi:hypothetical protein